MTRKRVFVFGVAMSLLLLGCGDKKETNEESAAPETEIVEPQYITVQHILIAFKGSLPGKPITRTEDEAKNLAEDILEKAKSGADFDGLVKEYTDDAHPGIYKMSNFGIPANMAEHVYARDGMVAAFGNVGFKLDVGDVGMAPYDVRNSPFGWHIIKRTK